MYQYHSIGTPGAPPTKYRPPRIPHPQSSSFILCLQNFCKRSRTWDAQIVRDVVSPPSPVSRIESGNLIDRHLWRVVPRFARDHLSDLMIQGVPTRSVICEDDVTTFTYANLSWVGESPHRL